MNKFAIINEEWISALNEPPEISSTSATIKIIIDQNIISRNEDLWSRTVSEGARLSAYPLALWFTSSWWRLFYELLPDLRSRKYPDTYWRMAHEMNSAGYGFLWPRILFVSQGNHIIVEVTPTKYDKNRALHYLAEGTFVIETKAFERAITSFIYEVLCRLDAMGLRKTELHDIWNELSVERENPDLARYRKLEAMLGFEPGEGPGDIVEQFENLITIAGESAVEELAYACVSADPGSALQNILSITDSKSLDGKITIKIPSRHQSTDLELPAWKRGWALAGEIRKVLGINNNPVEDNVLSDILNIDIKNLFKNYTSAHNRAGIAIRDDHDDSLRFFLRKTQYTGRRFELARFIGDYLMSNKYDRWLPETDSKSTRQRLQRAFAGELLCPISGIKEQLQDDFSDDSIDEAARVFKVSPLTVRTQLVNHKELEPDTLDRDDYSFDYHYFDTIDNHTPQE